MNAFINKIIDCECTNLITSAGTMFVSCQKYMDVSWFVLTIITFLLLNLFGPFLIKQLVWRIERILHAHLNVECHFEGQRFCYMSQLLSIFPTALVLNNSTQRDLLLSFLRKCTDRGKAKFGDQACLNLFFAP